MTSQSETTNFHQLLTSVYGAIKAIPCRPDVIYYPHSLLPKTDIKSYMRVHYLGSTDRTTRIGGSSIIHFEIQVDIAVENRTMSEELNDYIQGVWDCFPPFKQVGCGAYIAEVRSLPTMNPFDDTGGGYRVVMTIPFRLLVKPKQNTTVEN